MKRARQINWTAAVCLSIMLLLGALIGYGYASIENDWKTAVRNTRVYKALEHREADLKARRLERKIEQEEQRNQAFRDAMPEEAWIDGRE